MFGGKHYTGVDLWTLLDTTVGLVDASGRSSGVVREYIVATGTDGYQAVIAMGEIAPRFGNVPVLLAYEVDGQTLGDEGFVRLIVPHDIRGGRSVANLARLEVVALPPNAHKQMPQRRLNSPSG